MRVHFNADFTKAYGRQDDFCGADGGVDFAETVEDEFKKITGSKCTATVVDFDEYVIPEIKDVGQLTRVSEIEHGWYWVADVKEE